MAVTGRKVPGSDPIGFKPRVAPVLRDGILTPVAVTINADPTKFDVATFSYAIAGKVYAKAASLANVFSAVHATGIAAWLGIGVYIDARGNITTAANPNTGDQDYGTEALALASIPNPAPGCILIATITLLTAAADWDANTDALDAADLVSSNLLGLFPDKRWDIWKPGFASQAIGLQSFCRSLTQTLQASLVMPKYTSRQVLSAPYLEVDRRTVANGGVTKLRFAAFDYLIDGVLYHTDAQKALAFTAAHVVAIDKWGAVLLLIDTAGVYSTLVGEATQTTPMAYTTAAAARAALPAVPAGKTPVGILVVEADNSTWTANTDDIVAGSDLEGFDLVPALPDRLLSDVTCSITVAEAEDFSLSAFVHSIAGVRATKNASTGNDFTANHVATASKYLAILVGINAAGTVSTKVPLVSGRSQTAAQGYDSYDAAIQALPTPSAGVLPVAIIVILADAGGWTANTDDMTPGSDCTNSWLVGLSTEQALGFVATVNVPATDRNALWPIAGAAFAADVPTDATLEGTILAAQAWKSATQLLQVGASVLAVSDDPKVTVTTRPWPMAPG